MTDYITSASLKATLDLGTETFADADITVAISAASRAIDGYKQTRFYPGTETRYYTAEECYAPFVYGRYGSYAQSIHIDDLNGSTAITVAMDTNGDGVYETTWIEGTDYYLDPVNATGLGIPYDRLTIRNQSGRVFPTYQRAIQIHGSFGWATAPAQVTQATTVLAARYLKRARETPYGLLTIVGDGVAAASLGKIDPDIAFLLDELGASVPQMIA